MQRGAGAKFMPNALVFPGGVATPSDEKLGPPTKIAALRPYSPNFKTPCEKLHLHGNTTHVLCPQHVSWPDEQKITNVLPGDHLYITEDKFNQPPRKLPLEEIQVDPHKPTHRAEYKVKPLYSMCKLYMHNLAPEYRNSFHQFETQSKQLA
ncbi:hypothetical protein ANCCEY_10281 [Ancylostoma ceylanicum]|uniref:Uncharacterized protein n=1 Tax=Ancylostoma ceylanicum TaxID=53326 RepID=A0A0D6LKU7_9BILA|nr:hypothetical protein ANCCEY_10281 [Ancylostoma ceylanicum]